MTAPRFVFLVTHALTGTSGGGDGEVGVFATAQLARRRARTYGYTPGNYEGLMYEGSGSETDEITDEFTDMSGKELRAACKDSWPGRWDISSAGHVGAGEASAPTAVRELAEELGLSLPAERFEYFFEYVERMSSEQRGGRFTNNERCDVFVVTLSARERATLDPASPHHAFALQAEEVSAVRWAPLAEVRALYESGDASIVPVDGWPAYARLFDELDARSLHMLGMHGSAYANYAVQAADVIIALGARFDDRVTGKPSTFAPAARAAAAAGRGGIIHFEVSPKNVNKVISADEVVHGDVRDNLRALLPLIAPAPRDEWFAQIAAWKRALP
jgi:isopentenyldiphosphate isomerase